MLECQEKGGDEGWHSVHYVCSCTNMYEYVHEGLAHKDRTNTRLRGN